MPDTPCEERGDAPAFDHDPPLDDVLARCKGRTGLDPPSPATPLRWSTLQPGDETLARVRAADGIPAPS